MKQYQLGDTNVDPDSQTLMVEHVVDLQETEWHCYRFHQQGDTKFDTIFDSGILTMLIIYFFLFGNADKHTVHIAPGMRK